MTLDSAIATIPSKWGSVVYEHFGMFPNDTVDFSQPFLRRSLKEIYPLFVAIYGLLILAGLVANVTMAMNIIMKRLYIDPVCAFLLNIAICNLVICIAVLPLSLAILLIQNWVFGRLLCYIAPMLQDAPVHASTISFLAVGIERYRSIISTSVKRVPSVFVVFISWFIAVCIVLPYMLYVHYLDMEKYLGAQFKDVGICAVSLDNDFAQYTRGLFIIVYSFPFVIVLYFHLKIISYLCNRRLPSNSVPLNSRPLAKPRHSTTSQGSRRSHGEIWTPQEPLSTPSILLSEPEFSGEIRRHSSIVPPSGIPPEFKVTRDTSPRQSTDGGKRKDLKDQFYHSFMALVFGLCLCPLMILRLFNIRDNSKVFDLTLICFVWIAFIPTLSTPAIFSFWRMNSDKRHRLDKYFNIPPSTYSQMPQVLQASDSILYSNSNMLSSEIPQHEPKRKISGHRLSIEASLSVSSHVHQHFRNYGRPLTPTPSHLRAMSHIQTLEYTRPQRNVRSLSLTYN